MKLKFRPSFEQLDARDLPSGNPVDPLIPPPTDPPPSQNGDPTPPSSTGSTSSGQSGSGANQPVDSQLVALILCAAATDDYTALTAYIQSLMPADEPTGGEPTDGGNGEPQTPSEGSEQPAPGVQPVPVVPKPFVAFDPIPAPTAAQLAAVRADLTAIGGRAPTDSEVTEVATLNLKIPAAIAGANRLRIRGGIWTGIVEGVQRSKDIQAVQVQVLTELRDEAQKTHDANKTPENLEQLTLLRGGVTAAQLTLDKLTGMLSNANDRFAYIEGKLTVSDALARNMQTRINQIRGTIKTGGGTGDPFAANFPVVTDLNSKRFNDLSKPYTD